VLTSGFRDHGCCGDRRLGGGRGVVVVAAACCLEEAPSSTSRSRSRSARARRWAWTSACMRRSVRLAWRRTSWPLTIACSLTIPRSAHSAFLACTIQ